MTNLADTRPADGVARAAGRSLFPLNPWKLMEGSGWLAIASICAGLAAVALWASSGAPMICH